MSDRLAGWIIGACAVIWGVCQILIVLANYASSRHSKDETP